MDPTRPFADEDGPWLYAGAIAGRWRARSPAAAQARVSRREAVENADDLGFEIAKQVGLNVIYEDADEKTFWKIFRSHSSEPIPPLYADLTDIERLEALDLGIHTGDIVAAGHGVIPGQPRPQAAFAL
jgi:hypothetical protein